MKILLILVSSFLANAEVSDWDLAQSLLKLEISGFRLRSGKNECLSPEKFPGLRVPKSRDTDGPSKPDCKLDENDEIKITSVKAGAVKNIEVKFEVKLKKKCLGKNQLSDSFSFLRNPEGDKKRGLAITTSPPKYLIVKKNCL